MGVCEYVAGLEGLVIGVWLIEERNVGDGEGDGVDEVAGYGRREGDLGLSWTRGKIRRWRRRRWASHLLP